MARGQISSRMEKFVYQNSHNIGATSDFEISWQIDSGEVEAQVKRIMLSLAGTPGQIFKLGLFQFQPTVADYLEDEVVVISGAIGNQFTHNETITMRVPKGWYIGLMIHNFNGAPVDTTFNLQLNYKVLN